MMKFECEFVLAEMKVEYRGRGGGARTTVELHPVNLRNGNPLVEGPVYVTGITQEEFVRNRTAIVKATFEIEETE